MKAKTKFLMLVFGLLFLGAAMGQSPTVDTSYFSEEKEGGVVEWFAVVGADTVALTGAPAALAEAEVADEEPVPVKKEVDEEQLNAWALAVGGILMVLLPFVLGLIAPKWAWVKDDRNKDLLAKALTIAVVVGVAIYTAGLGNVWQILLTWVIAQIGYDKGLKAFNIRTPSPAKAVK